MFLNTVQLLQSVGRRVTIKNYRNKVGIHDCNNKEVVRRDAKKGGISGNGVTGCGGKHNKKPVSIFPFYTGEIFVNSLDVEETADHCG